MSRDVTQQRLRELFWHCPRTGEFIRRRPAQGIRSSIGESAGWVNRKGYIEMSVDGRRYYAHRLAWLYHFGQLPDGDVDHINSDGGDNRIENLQVLSRAENLKQTWFRRGNEKPYRPNRNES